MPSPTRSRYSFASYDGSWPQRFRESAADLQALLGRALLRVHHIGSTSVSGLAAKPIIDLLPVVRSLPALDARAGALEAAGYKSWGEYGLPGRRYFTADAAGVRTHNVHCYAVGDPDIERHLAFCAYLRAHGEARDAYESVKRDAYALYPDDIGAYSDAKDGWIKNAEREAFAWYQKHRPDGDVMTALDCSEESRIERARDWPCA